MVTKRVIVLPKLQPEAAPAAPQVADRELGAPLPQPGFEGSPQPPPAAPVPAARVREGAAAAPALASSFWPLLICTTAWLAWMGFHTVQLNLDRQALKNAHAQLQPTLDKSAQLRGALDALAADTQRLAEGGNANARLLVDELKRRGVTINPAAPSASAPK